MRKPAKILCALAFAAAASLASGCANGGANDAADTNGDAAARADAGQAPPSGTWIAKALPGADGAPRIEFVDGRATGHSGCNGFNAPYTLGDGGALAFGPVVSTKKFCDGEPGRTEQAVFAALAATKRASVEGGTMRLHGADGAVLLELSRAP
jgi:heat shock protein HslJ